MNPATSTKQTFEATCAIIIVPFCRDMDRRPGFVSDHVSLTKFDTCVITLILNTSCTLYMPPLRGR